MPGHMFRSTRRPDVLFRADGGIDWDRWNDVPILKRDDLLQQRRAMLARKVPEGHEQIRDVSTTGSTGRAVTTSHSALALELTKAAIFRANVNDEVDFGTRLGAWSGERADRAPWPEGQHGGRWGPPWDVRAETGRTHTVSHTAPPAQALEFLARQRGSICHDGRHGRSASQSGLGPAVSTDYLRPALKFEGAIFQSRLHGLALEVLWHT